MKNYEAPTAEIKKFCTEDILGDSMPALDNYSDKDKSGTEIIGIKVFDRI